MHIKQITISGFKSYRDATVAGPFSSGHNVVVGRNGSGKSNFFDAVRFVLSDTFSSLRAEERVALLHEGAGASVLSAYVEMLFDNSDGRLPSDREEVALRRMVGLKKDEYVLDRKNVTRTEVFNLLESAGFSRSNPYYIVQQGKVAALCAMTDRQRLELLKEVAGTRVYDERREESLKIMEETDGKREKITEVINYIESRLAELESEKEELKAFQRVDKERKALEYTIHVRELEEAKAALEFIDGDRGHQRSRGEELHARLIEVRATIAAAARDIKSLAPELKRAKEERDALNSKRKVAIDKVAKLQVNVSEAEQTAAAATETITNSRQEMENIQLQIVEKKRELEPLRDELKELESEEGNVRKRKKDVESKLLNLRVKADRTNQFSSVQARDAHLKKDMKEARKRKTSFTAQIASARKDIERLEKGITRNEAKCEAKQKESQELQSNADRANEELGGFRRDRDELHTKRNDLWRQEAELDSKIKELQNGMGRLEAAKRSVMGSSAYNAISFLMEAALSDHRNFGPDRVYGPLVDLINVDSRYSTAADVTGGSSLLNIVVDNDETAAKLVRIMQQNRAGRLTFIPLNRIEGSSRPPEVSAEDAIPLVSKIACDPRFDSVVKHVFGKVLVTRTVQLAADLSRQYGIDCVTLEGDQVNKRGGMTGGFMDISRSRIDATRYLREARSELSDMRPKADEIRASAAAIDGDLARVLGEVQRREAFQRTANSKVARLKSEILQLERYVLADKESIPVAAERISVAEQSIESTEKGIQDLEAELALPMVSGLSAEEENLLSELKDELEVLRSEIGEKVTQKTGLNRSVGPLQAELKNLEANLKKREAELKTTVSSLVGDGSGATDGVDAQAQTEKALEEQREALSFAEAELNSIKKNLKKCEAVVIEKDARYNGLNSQTEQGRDEESKINKSLEDDRQIVEKRYSQRSIETQKKSEAEKSIRELGSLPADFDKYRELSVGVLMKKLKKANQSLQKYSHVNKKALDQFINFTEQREALTRSREELDAGAVAIRQLIDSLDQRKDEDILRTFKGVSKFFSEVFRELVPGGKASLVMLKSSGESRNGRDGEEEMGARIQYTGVAMKIAFSSTGEAYLLRQLSGGQKSIVALALIFSIQRLDPAPFYLFDEIDANLDATHRQAVANLIRKQANSGTQFVTTTFRPEFVNAGDIWYGVTHKKKVSGIQEVSRDVALTFIIDEPTRR